MKMVEAGSKRPAGSDPDVAGPMKKRKGAMSFAERMMQKMGHVKGKGLGKDGAGIVNPIEVKLRPQGAGVGMVKEMTPQAKAEAKRAAKQAGEEFEDSSDEELKASSRRRNQPQNQQKRLGASSGTASFTPARPKVKVRTAADIEAEDGFVVPDIFKTLIDRTGSAADIPASAAGIFTTSVQAPKDTELDKVIKYARTELEAFSNRWTSLKIQFKGLDLREQRHNDELKHLDRYEERFQEVDGYVEELSALGELLQKSTSIDDLAHAAERLVIALDNLRTVPRDDVKIFRLSDVAAGAVAPLFRAIVRDWEPLKDKPSRLLPYLQKAKQFFEHAGPVTHKARRGDEDDLEDDSDSDDTASAFDAMIARYWLPVMETAVDEDWNVSHPNDLLIVLEDWKAIVPPKSTVFEILINESVLPRLNKAVDKWRPGNASKHGRREADVWLFPWLQYLDSYNLDPMSSHGILAEVKRKFRTALDNADVSRGSITGLDQWLSVSLFKKALDRELQFKLLPHLGKYLQGGLSVNPLDQDVTPIKNVLQWKHYFSTAVFGRLLLAEFFKKLLDTLHRLLTDGSNYGDIAEWFERWHNVFPEDLRWNGRTDDDVSKQWGRGLDMMEQAMSMPPKRGKKKLVNPVVEDEKARSRAAADKEKSAAKKEKAKTSNAAAGEPSMRDLLDDICARTDLLLLPMRKAHPDNGLPLLRVTASPAGTGGIVVYIKDDQVWSQSKTDRELWEPVDVYDKPKLIKLAEMK